MLEWFSYILVKDDPKPYEFLIDFKEKYKPVRI